MNESDKKNTAISRRRFVGGAAAAAAAAAVTPGKVFGAPAFVRRANTPDSNFNGVRVGIIAPYAFRGTVSTAEEILEKVLELGLSYVEMQNGPIEGFAGAPSGREDREALREWRLSASMEPYRELRRMYEEAGVTIEIVKFGLGPNMTDEETHYVFEVAKAMGARAITCEPPVSETKRLGRFAEIHRVMLAYHNHADAEDVERFCRPGSWEQTFFYSPFNGANVDIGHWMAGNGYSPAEFIQTYNRRISNLHLKDREVDGPNQPWGEGDTPIRDILQLLQREQYHQIQATIELEYTIPDDSDVMTELHKLVDYCRDAVA